MNNADPLAYDLAKLRVDMVWGVASRTSPDVLAMGPDSQQCWDCDALLKAMNDAFASIADVERGLQSLAYHGTVDFDRQWRKKILGLYDTWQFAAQVSESWSGFVLSKGFDLANLSEFQRCREAVADAVERCHWAIATTESNEAAGALEPW